MIVLFIFKNPLHHMGLWKRKSLVTKLVITLGYKLVVALGYNLTQYH